MTQVANFVSTPKVKRPECLTTLGLMSHQWGVVTRSSPCATPLSFQNAPMTGPLPASATHQLQYLRPRALALRVSAQIPHTHAAKVEPLLLPALSLSLPEVSSPPHL